MGLKDIMKGITGTVLKPKQDKDAELNKNIDLMVEAGTQHVKKWEPYYSDGHNYLWNNQLIHQRPLKGWERIQENHIFPAAQQAMSLLALQKPKFVCNPVEESDVDPAAKWEKVLQWYFQEGLDMPSIRLGGKLDGQSHGHFAVKLYWEPEAEWDEETLSWKGELRIQLLQPGMVCLDPTAEGPHAVEHSEHAYYLREVPLEWAKQRWPKFKEQIEREAEGKGESAPGIAEALRLGTGPSVDIVPTYDGDAESGEHGYVPPDSPEGRLSGLLSYERETDVTRQQSDGVERKATIVILEIWFKDYSRKATTIRTPIPAEELQASGMAALAPDETGAEVWHDTATGEKLTPETWPNDERVVQAPVYPHGRHILRIGKNIIIEDEAVALDEWGLVVGTNVQLPHTWHGLNNVEMARGMQDFKNITWNNFLRYNKTFGQPNVLVESGAVQGCPTNEGIADKLRTNLWKLEPNGIKGLSVLTPPQLGQTVFDILSKVEESLRDTTGMQDIAMGKKAPGEQTATEALELQTNSKVRTALENMNMDLFTLDVMRKVHMFLKAHLQDGNVVRILGPEQSLTVDDAMLNAKFDLQMEIGTVLPFDEERERQKADKVLQVVGPEYTIEWLKAHDVKNAEDWAAAAMEYMAAQAEAEREAQAQKNKSGAAAPKKKAPAASRSKSASKPKAKSKPKGGKK